MNPFKAVREFHEKYKCDIDRDFSVELLELRDTLISEELDEFLDEIHLYKEEYRYKDAFEINKSALTKELADLIYVTVGFAVTFGLPLEEVFKRVHESNMTKTLDNKREDGKVLKGDDYKPPKLDDLFKEKSFEEGFMERLDGTYKD